MPWYHDTRNWRWWRDSWWVWSPIEEKWIDEGPNWDYVEATWSWSGRTWKRKEDSRGESLPCDDELEHLVKRMRRLGD